MSETNPKNLSWPISPAIVVDDFNADLINVSLSPEIPISTFVLSECFKNKSFKNNSNVEWAKVLRKIADELEK